MEPPISYSDFTVPTAACEMVVLFDLPAALCYTCRLLSLEAPSLSYELPPTNYHRRSRKGGPADELNTRARANKH